MKSYCRGLAAASLLVFLIQGQNAQSAEWLTWGGGPDRAGWQKSETVITPQNVSGMHLKWKLHLDLTPKFEVLSSSTAPLVVENVATREGPKTVVFVVDANDTVYAVDAANGKTLWKRGFPTSLKPPKAATYLCPNTQNATPV